MIATTAPGDKSNMIVTTSHPGIWTRTVDVYIGRLRDKLGDRSERPRYVATVRGTGYRAVMTG